MSEWWTYRPSDFLLFSPQAYWALFEQENAALWPAPFFALGLGCLLIALASRPAVWSSVLALSLIALAWAWVGWSFMGHRYAGINWAASYMVPLFALQATLAGGLAVMLKNRPQPGGWPPPRLLGLCLIAYAVFVHPLWPLLSGRPIGTAEIAFIAPDPTAIVTLGVAFVFLRGIARWVFLLAPKVWLTLSAVTLLTMGAPQGWVLAAIAVLALAGALWDRPPKSPHTVEAP